MKFVYEGHETSTLGYTFKDGKPTDVTDERAIKKLQGNHAFTEFVAPKPKAKAKPKVESKSNVGF